MTAICDRNLIPVHSPLNPPTNSAGGADEDLGVAGDLLLLEQGVQGVWVVIRSGQLANGLVKSQCKQSQECCSDAVAFR